MDKPLYKFTEAEVDTYLQVSERDGAGPSQADSAPGPQEHRPAVRAVSAGRDAVRAVRSAADLLPGQERLPRVHRAHVRDGPVAQLAQLHEACCSGFAIATASSASPRATTTPRPIGIFPTAGSSKTSRRSWPATRPSSSSETIDRSKFLKNRYHLDVNIPIEKHEDIYLPYEEIDRAKSQLQDGDFVNIVRATARSPVQPLKTKSSAAARSSGHVGLIGHGPNGEVHLIHSSEPKVREEPIDEYIARSTKDLAEKDAAGKPRLVGFKFLRLRDEPLKNLKAIDGADAPRVTLPSGEEAKF